MHDAADIFLYRDFSIAPLHDMRRSFKAVMDVLDSMISHGVTLSRSVELTAQWGNILYIGSLYPVMLDALHAEVAGLGDFRPVVGDVHHRLSDFIHRVVVHRRDEAIRVWRNWLRVDLLVHPNKWLRTDMVHPLLFCSVSLILLQVVLGFWLILPGLTRNSERPGFPTFAVLGKGIPALRNSTRRSRGGYLCCLRLLLPRLTGQMLADVVQRATATASSLDG